MTLSRRPTPATKFARCHHFSPDHAIPTKKRNTTRLKCCARHAKWRWRSPKCHACHEKCNSSSENDACACHTKQLLTWMSQSGTPATQDNIATSFATLKKDKFCSFPHRHGDATRKPKNQDETCCSLKASISCKTSLNVQTLYLKIDVFLRIFFNKPETQLPQNRCFVRLPPIFIASRIPHKITCLPQNLPFTQPWQCDPPKARNTTRLKCCAYRAKWRWKPPKCRACHKNCNSSSENDAKNIAPATQNNFWHFTKHVWMSQSGTLATRNEATRHLKPPKVTPFAKLAIGTAIWASHGRWRTVADGCTASGEHSLSPQTPRVKREPLLRIREKNVKRLSHSE